MNEKTQRWVDRLAESPGVLSVAVPAYVATMIGPSGTSVVVSGETADETLAALVEAVLVTETYDTWKKTANVQGDET